MADTLRSKTIRLAASMPKDSPERKALLDVLASERTAGKQNTTLNDLYWLAKQQFEKDLLEEFVDHAEYELKLNRQPGAGGVRDGLEKGGRYILIPLVSGTVKVWFSAETDYTLVQVGKDAREFDSTVTTYDIVRRALAKVPFYDDDVY